MRKCCLFLSRGCPGSRIAPADVTKHNNCVVCEQRKKKMQYISLTRVFGMLQSVHACKCCTPILFIALHFVSLRNSCLSIQLNLSSPAYSAQPVRLSVLSISVCLPACLSVHSFTIIFPCYPALESRVHLCTRAESCAVPTMTSDNFCIWLCA